MSAPDLLRLKKIVKRDAHGNAAYWNKWVTHGERTISDDMEATAPPSNDPGLVAQYVYERSAAS